MSAKLKYTIVILATLGLAIGTELLFAFDGNPDTPPWTDLIVRFVPWQAAAGAFVLLALWLPAHFYIRYRRKERDSG